MSKPDKRILIPVEIAVEQNIDVDEDFPKR